MKITAVHRATIADDTHRDEAGVLVLDGAVKLSAQTYSGPSREGWPEHVIGWISPAMGQVLQVPAVGSDVLLLQFDGGELRWANIGLDRPLASWFTLSMTAIASKGGATQLVLDEEGVKAGAFDASDPVALWPGTKGYVNDEIGTPYNGHTHQVPVAALAAALAIYFVEIAPPPAPPVPPVTIPTAGPLPQIVAADAEGAATKMKAV